MDSTPLPLSADSLTYNVAGLEYGWDLGSGAFTIGGVPCIAFFRDTSFARLRNAGA